MAMRDFAKLTFTKIWTFCRHNPFLVFAAIAMLFASLWLFGCEPRAQSPTGSGKKITRSELKMEINYFLEKAEIADKEIAQNEQLRDLLLRQGLIIAQGGTINYYSLITSALSILGVGSILDNRRKDSKIKIQKDNLEALTNANSE